MNRSSIARSDSSGRAMLALMSLGEPGWPPLRTAITNRADANRLIPVLNLRLLIRRLGTNASIVIPGLIECTADGQDMVAIESVKMLGDLSSDPANVVPALTNCLNRTNIFLRHAAVQAIGRFGPQARDAVPTLINLLSDTNVISREARKALLAIEPDVLGTNRVLK